MNKTGLLSAIQYWKFLYFVEVKDLILKISKKKKKIQKTISSKFQEVIHGHSSWHGQN